MAQREKYLLSFWLLIIELNVHIGKLNKAYFQVINFIV